MIFTMILSPHISKVAIAKDANISNGEKAHNCGMFCHLNRKYEPIANASVTMLANVNLARSTKLE